MNSQERTIVSSLVVLMILLWLGFLWHRDPAFPGSFIGFGVGLSASVLMLIPLVYMTIKRNKSLKKVVTKHIAMPKLLRIHIYAGVLGPILALIHSAHRFDSATGVSIIIFMMVVVISGFVGRYVLGLISSNVKEKKRQVNELHVALSNAKQALKDAVCDDRYSTFAQTSARHIPYITLNVPTSAQSKLFKQETQVLSIIDTISDVEYSILIHDTAKVRFARWLKFHIVISMTLYVVLFFHIFSEVYFGLRWL